MSGGAGAGRGAANSEAAPKLAQLNLAAHGARRAAAARGPGNPANAKCSDRILAAQRAFATFSARAGWTRAGPSPPCTAARQAVPDPLGGCAQHPGPWVGWQVSSRALTHGQRRRPPGAGALGRPLGAGPQVYSPRAAAGPSLCSCTDKAGDGSAAVRRALPVVPLLREPTSSSCPPRAAFLGFGPGGPGRPLCAHRPRTPGNTASPVLLCGSAVLLIIRVYGPAASLSWRPRS